MNALKKSTINNDDALDMEQISGSGKSIF